MTRQLSETKTRKRFQHQKPVVVDITGSQSERATMPTIQEQLDTLNAIKAYNKGLKPARRAKDSLPEITTTNIAT
jgi:Na+/H+-dicarboxylate symporter